MERIRLEGVRCRCRVGILGWERAKRQAIELDLALEVGFRAACKTDDFRLTADYWAVEKAVRAAVEAGEFRLLERLAWVAAEAALGADRRVRSVTVAAYKKPAVMPRTRRVAVELTLRR